jgi:hypothetical protein
VFKDIDQTIKITLTQINLSIIVIVIGNMPLLKVSVPERV